VYPIFPETLPNRKGKFNPLGDFKEKGFSIWRSPIKNESCKKKYIYKLGVPITN